MDAEREAELARVREEIVETKRRIAELEIEKARNEARLVGVFEEIIRGSDDCASETESESDSTKTVAGLANKDPLFRKALFEAISESKTTSVTSIDFERDALMAWDRGNLEEAVLLYTRAIEIDPNNAVALMNRGNVQIEIGSFDDAISDLEKPVLSIPRCQLNTCRCGKHFRQRFVNLLGKRCLTTRNWPDETITNRNF